MKLSPSLPVMALLVLLLASSGCMVGPNYKRPAAVAPPAFKEQPPVNFKEAEAAGWKQSQPGDAYSKGRWWELYNDPALNALEEQVRRFEPERSASRGAVPASQGCGKRGPRRVVSDRDHCSGDHRSGGWWRRRSPETAREYPAAETASICRSTLRGSRIYGETFAAE